MGGPGSGPQKGGSLHSKITKKGIHQQYKYSFKKRTKNTKGSLKHNLRQVIKKRKK